MHKTPLNIPCIGYSIAADWYPVNTSDRILLVLVGYGSSKERNADLIEEIAEKSGMNALAVDLSGHGDSPFALDDTMPAQHLLEVMTVFDWLQATYPSAKISVMGTSYGGYMASWLTRFRDFDKLILRTPAIYRPEDFYSPHSQIEKAEHLAAYRGGKSQVAHNPLFLQEAVFSGKTLLMTHENDEDIPLATSDVYQSAYNAETYLAKGFWHSFRDPRNSPAEATSYKQMIATWLNK